MSTLSICVIVAISAIWISGLCFVVFSVAWCMSKRKAYLDIASGLTAGTMTLNNGKINIVKDTADTI